MNTNGQPKGINYWRALEGREATAQVTLGGLSRTVPRARLGLHHRLLELLTGGDLIEVVLPYISLASGVPEEEIQLEECAGAFNTLVTLNQPRGAAALARAATVSHAVPPAFNYPGRGLAAIVHDLAFAYGWTADYILDLPPEEAWCYLQEIHLDRHEGQKWDYQLSDLGRDKRGHQKPMRDPLWFRIGYEERAPRRSAPAGPGQRPSGTVINLNELAAQRRSR